MMLNPQEKDWKIAFGMFGNNSKQHCKIVQKLRVNGIISHFIDEWFVISDKNKPDEIGYLIHKVYLNE